VAVRTEISSSQMASRMQLATFSVTGFPFSGYSAAVINERVARKIRSRSIWHAYVTCVLMRVSKVGFPAREMVLFRVAVLLIGYT
jgi:hypothetical protein